MKKRSLFKRIAAIAMSAAMVLGMTTAASAAEEVTKAPTINETTGSLTIEKYAKNDELPEGDTTTPISGVQFNYVQVGDFSLAAGSVNGFTLNNNLLDQLTIEPITGTTDLYDGQTVQKALTEALKVPANRTAIEALAVNEMAATGTDGKTTVSTLPIGLYLVVEKDAPSQVVRPSDPFIVSIPILETEEDGTQTWNYDVVAQPKNETDDNPPPVEKTVTGYEEDKISATLNQILEFKLSADIKQNFGELTHLKFVDTMSKGLSMAKQDGTVIEDLATVAANDVVVKGIKNDGTDVVDTITTGFTVTAVASTDDEGNAITVLTIKFTDPDQIKKDYKHIDITYKAKLNENAVVMDKENSNDVRFEYGREENATQDGVDIYTYGYTLAKKNEKKEALAGAEFQIFKTAEDAKAGTNPIKFLDAKTGGQEVSTAISAKDTGIVGFYGLAAGEYWIAETKAPEVDGVQYNLLKEPIKITVSKDSGKNTGDLEVINTTGFTLPQTGGTGTIIFTVGGIAIMLGAALLLIRANRKSKAN